MGHEGEILLAYDREMSFRVGNGRVGGAASSGSGRRRGVGPRVGRCGRHPAGTLLDELVGFTEEEEREKWDGAEDR